MNEFYMISFDIVKAPLFVDYFIVSVLQNSLNGR